MSIVVGAHACTHTGYWDSLICARVYDKFSVGYFEINAIKELTHQMNLYWDHQQ